MTAKQNTRQNTRQNARHNREERGAAANQHGLGYPGRTEPYGRDSAGRCDPDGLNRHVLQRMRPALDY